MNKPVVLSDLDDTLFQTRRKMVDELALEPFRTGAVDRTLNPRSFMTEEQSMLVDWLLEQAELIPVTARGTEEISRVRIPFPLLGNHHSRGRHSHARRQTRRGVEGPYARPAGSLSGKADIDAASDH